MDSANTSLKDVGQVEYFDLVTTEAEDEHSDINTEPLSKDSHALRIHVEEDPTRKILSMYKQLEVKWMWDWERNTMTTL